VNEAHFFEKRMDGDSSRRDIVSIRLRRRGGTNGSATRIVY
jgi:hypothetical protein